MTLHTMIESLAFLLFLGAWLGYEGYHTGRSRRRPEATRHGQLLARQRGWAAAAAGRDEPLLIVHTLRNLGRQTIFLGSLTLLSLGGAFGLLLSSDRLLALCAVTRLFGPSPPVVLQLKLLLLLVVLALAFLEFVWGLRALLAAHLFTIGPADGAAASTAGLVRYLEYFQLDFRRGLRAAYYAVTLLIWLFNTGAFVVVLGLLAVSLARYDLGHD
jgi:uncharacterized membrane protein